MNFLHTASMYICLGNLKSQAGSPSLIYSIVFPVNEKAHIQEQEDDNITTSYVQHGSYNTIEIQKEEGDATFAFLIKAHTMHYISRTSNKTQC